MENGYVLAKTRLPASETERQLRRIKRMTNHNEKETCEEEDESEKGETS